MTINYNGAERSTGILTFSDVPNILQVKENIYGVKSQLTMQVVQDLKRDTEYNNQYYITLFGETITNVMSPQQATNKRFYVGNSDKDTAISIVRALRNCSSLAAEFNITTATTENDGDTVVLTAKNIGFHNFTGNIDRNIPTYDLIFNIVNEGSADDDGNKLFNSKIDVDVHSDEYITTLEKNWYGDECAFDVSPVLATMTEPTKDNEQLKAYTLKVSRLADDGVYDALGTVSGYTTYGFLANQSQKYLPLQVQLLSNSKTTDRGGILYTYDPTIKYSVLARVGSSGGFSITYTVRNSSMEAIYSTVVTYNTPMGDAFIKDVDWTVPQVNGGTPIWVNAYYVDVQLNADIIRYQVIKPLKATEYWQRVYWRGCYGQVSFFDFTGSKSESDNIDNTTYQKSIFDLYDVDDFQLNKVYDKKTTKTVKLKTHIMEKNGIYVFNEMKKSKLAWTEVNGVVHYIIIKNVEVEEDNSYDGLYTATIEYEYSYED